VGVSYLTFSLVGMDDLDMVTPGVPPRLRALMGEPALAKAWELQISARRAEAAKMQVLLEHVAAARQAYASEPQFVQDDAERAAVHQAALVLGFSDHSTASALHTSEYARHHLPRCWEAFCRGLIDL